MFDSYLTEQNKRHSVFITDFPTYLIGWIYTRCPNEEILGHSHP